MHTNPKTPAIARRTLVLTVAIVVSVMLLAAKPSQAAETVIYSQTSAAIYPESDLVSDSNGVLYGTTRAGGIDNAGAVFSLTPPAKGQTSWTEAVLYSFQGGTDGDLPTAGLAADGEGGFFGVTSSGGGGPCVFGSYSGCGVVFHLTPPAQGQTNWTETVLYRFQGPDGNSPLALVTLDSATGVLYGTTYFGGASNAGTVFALTPPAEGQTNWTESVLYSFTGANDGGYPFAYVTAGANGSLYGTTTTGGFTGNGTVFLLTPPTEGETNWTETVLYSFHGWGYCDAGYPDAGLIADTSGNLYSTTAGGGCNNFGTVFELSPPSGGQTSWTETILYAFAGGKDGAVATNDIIMDANGAIYSTTAAGGKSNNGMVFKLTPPGAGETAWTEKILWSFKGSSGDGAVPYSGLTVGKVGKKVVLFGDTYDGGSNDYGVVYEITGSGFAP